MAVIVMIVGEHSKDPFLDEKCRFSVRELFRCTGQAQADSADSVHVVISAHLPGSPQEHTADDGRATTGFDPAIRHGSERCRATLSVMFSVADSVRNSDLALLVEF